MAAPCAASSRPRASSSSRWRACGGSSSSAWAGQALAQSSGRAVDLKADADVDELLNPSPADLVEQAALFRYYDSKEALVRNLKGERRSRSPSVSSSPKSVHQPPRVTQSVRIDSVVGAYFRGSHWQDDDDAQRRITMDMDAHRLIRRSATPTAKAKAEPRVEHMAAEAEPPPRRAVLGLMTEGQDKNLIRDD